MNKLTLFAVSVALSCPGAFAFQHAEAALQPQAQEQASSAARPSPAEQSIAAARQQIATDAKRPQGYNELAIASIRRARETGDPRFLGDAETALATGLQLAPNDFQLQKTSIALLLGRQQFTQALAKAGLLHSKVPDDVTLYGYLAEANIALGNYTDADTDAQWMLNLRPNNIPGLLLGARLRMVYGDAPGALEFLNQAFGETPQIEPEEQASIANRIAEIELAQGQLPAAGQALAQAEGLFPRSSVTRMNLARLRLAQGKPLEAVSLLQQQAAQEQAQGSSSTGTLFLLAQAQGAAKQPEAAATWSRFEASAKAETDKPANSNLDLILYYAGLADAAPVNAGAALALAQQRVATQHDADTLDAYAWALYANGKFAEADGEMQKAMAPGTGSAQFDEHAGEIARKLNKGDQATQSFAAAMQANPASPYAALARRQLGTQPVPPSVVSESVPPADTPAKPASTEPVIPIQLSHDTGGLPTTLLIPRPTGTARIIRRQQALVEAHPKEPGGYSGLGAAFFQRARETGDVEDYQLSEQALTKSLDLVSTDLSATAPLETMAEVCMGEHRFTDALDYAQKALALGSGDLAAFATVGDAYADMGEYEKASIAYSRMQPVTADSAKTDARAAYAQRTRTAYLSFVSGDTPGAIREMRTAIGEGVQAQVIGENLAWLYFELGEFSYQGGDIQQAADAYLTALNVYPGDYRALAGLGKVRAAQGKYADAITLYQSAIAVVPMPLYVAELGDIYAKTGRTAEAEKQYKLVEYIGLLGHINQVLHNRDLALFYADHDRNLAESLRLARKEFEVRSDIYTWDALGWALYKNGKYPEANEAMSHALRLGTRDPLLLFHAGMISAKAGHDAQALSQLDAAMKINPRFNTLYAEVAAQQLSTLRNQSASVSDASVASGKGVHAR